MVPVKPEGVTWTDDQWEAIYEDGRNIIVSAGAGSGKTLTILGKIYYLINILYGKHLV